MNKKTKRITLLTLSAFACSGAICGTVVAVSANHSNVTSATVGQTVHIGDNDYTSIYETGFENCPTGTYYQGTVIYTASQGNGLSWEVYYGTSSTSLPITGSNSIQMRLYSDGNRGYLKTTKSIDLVKAFSFKYSVDSKNMKFDVSYSNDNGDNWTLLDTISPADINTSYTYSHEFTTSNDSFRLKVDVSDKASKPSSGNIKLNIDDVVFGKEITNDVITSVKVTSTKEEPATYKYGEVINKSDFNAVVTKNGGAGSIDDLTVQVGKVENDTFVPRSDVIYGTTTVDLDDNAFLFSAKYPTTPQGSEFLTSRLNFTTIYNVLTEFTATESLEFRERETGTVEVTVNKYADPRATFTSSDEEVATVDPNTGVVTGVNNGTCTITSTSVGKTSSGESMSATTTVTVLKGPLFENDFRTNGFTSVQTKMGKYEETKDFGNNLFLTFSGNSSGGGKIVAPHSTNGQQIGTSKLPFSSFSFMSGHQGAYKISKVVIVTKRASPNSKAKISVIGTTNNLICEQTASPVVEYDSDTKEETFSFVPSTEAEYGNITIEFSDVTNGMYIKNIQIFGDLSKGTNEAIANAFAKRVELANTCSDQAQLIADYDALGDEVKEVADSIIIHDWNGSSSSKGARTLELNVLEKMTAIKSRQSEHDGSSRLDGINAQSFIAALTTVTLILGIGFVSIIIIKKKKKSVK